jgi:outer membrane protein OmpA-like peptidoglycan-associated protein
MESPLSFNSSENFRKKLLVRNLPPYKIENAFSQDGKPGSNEFNINDLVPIDSPSVEQIGNQQEKVLLPINQYGPQTVTNDYGDIVPINNNKNYKSNEGEYGYPDSIGSDLEVIGNNTEKQIIIKNVYRPENGLSDFGSTAWYINNDKVISTIGEGEYTVQDTVGGGLETTANLDRPSLISNNQYGPEIQTNAQVPINNNLQSNPNEGEYGYPDTVNSQLETKGETDRPVLFAINQYGPDNQPNTSVVINQNLQTNSNEGEYGYPDTVDSQLEMVGVDERKPNFLQNPWGPEGSQSTTEVDPYRKQKNLIIPQGNYLDETDTYGNELEFVSGVKETQAYLSNKYATGDGEYDPTEFKTLQTVALQLPYANSDNTFIFLPSTYTPYSILLSDNPSGSDGSLTQDSDLANIGAKSLNKEFKHRVALELYQQTLGQINLFSGNVNPETGEISAKPNTDPFNAIGLLTGNVPVIARKYNITTPDFLFGQGINFAAKLAGLYSPYSYIPGEIFDYPDPIGNGPYENPLSLIGGALGSLFSALQPANQSSSELLVEYTSIATRKLLYDQLRYNPYRPNYKIGNNLLAPPGVFYIGDRKNHLIELVSPASELPYAKDGKTSAMGPVLSYSSIGKLYEGDQLNETQFGLNSRNFYGAGANKDGVKWIGANIFGGLTWTGSKSPEKDNNPGLGKLVGRGGEQFEDNSEFNFGSLVGFDSSKSTSKSFTPGSILDVTQKLVDAGQRSTAPLEHVGTAINQVSKVFNDGYQELTKGSRVVRYTTPNSKPQGTNTPQGYEYCRVFTKDRPYYTYDELQKRDGNIRGYGNSVLDNTWNLNIAPVDGYSIKDGRVKKYMLSLENLAWRSSNKKDFTYDDLPACEKGPNGGRIMWFPPYDLSFSENISTGWKDNTFLGRTEPIYTYSNSTRKGNISFKIIVDHPSIMNLLVEKELANVSNNGEITQIIDSFYAGCTKYDLWDLVTKFPMFTPNDIFQAQILTTEDIVTVVEENNFSVIEQEYDINTTITTTVVDDCIEYDYNVGAPSTATLTYTGCGETTATNLSLNSGDKGQFCSVTKSKPFFQVYDVANTITPTGKACKKTTTSTSTTVETEKPKDLKVEYKDLAFYFDNNFPDGTNNKNGVTTTQDYKHWYDLYINKENTYISNALNKVITYGDTDRKDVTSFVTGNALSVQGKIEYLSDFIETRKENITTFFKYIKDNYSLLEKFVQDIGKLLDEGKDVSFELEASASSVNQSELNYNLNLSKRRGDSVLQWLYKQKTPQQKSFNDFKGTKLKITENYQGNNPIIMDKDYQFIDCKKGFINKQQEGIVSVNAMGCRRTKITKLSPGENISQTQNPPVETSNTQTNQELSGQDYEVTGDVQVTTTANDGTSTSPSAATDIRVQPTENSTPVSNTPPNTREQEVQTQQLQQRKDITKRLARKLLTECNYFEYIKQTDPMVYDGIKSKIKGFHPAFHSITPEGLNSRLVFLQQCMRPGDTIPTVSQDGSLLYNDVTNSAFGAPPICVLRVGDFFHTKVAIDSISLKYEDGRFDLNPEGIGIQPMIASVDISFAFIGAHGLAGPVAKLQNALSFNYYANTEMYDERAEVTDNIDLSTYNAQILSQVRDELNVVDTKAPRPEINNGGVTIGKTLTNVLNIDTTQTTGTIEYKDVMTEFVNTSKSYFETTTATLSKVNDDFLLGGLQILTKDRKYTEGYFNSLGGNLSNTANIFGYSDSFQTKIENLATQTKNDVDTDLCPLLAGLNNEPFIDVQIRKIKRQIKIEIDNRAQVMAYELQGYSDQISDNELNLVSLIDKINYVSNSHDGFIKKNNSVVVYNVSGTTQVTPPTNVVDTLQELIQDSYLIKDDLNTYYQKLQDFGLIPTGVYDYSENYTQDMYLPNNNTTQNETRFFMMFGKPICDDPDKFVDIIIKEALPNANSEDTGKWKTFFDNKLKSPETGLQPIYLTSKTIVDKKIEDFKTEYFNSTFTNYKPYNVDKQRLMWYESQVPATSPYDRDLINIYSSRNSSGDKFNLKKNFN